MFHLHAPTRQGTCVSQVVVILARTSEGPVNYMAVCWTVQLRSMMIAHDTSLHGHDLWCVLWSHIHCLQGDVIGPVSDEHPLVAALALDSATRKAIHARTTLAPREARAKKIAADTSKGRECMYGAVHLRCCYCWSNYFVFLVAGLLVSASNCNASLTTLTGLTERS